MVAIKAGGESVVGQSCKMELPSVVNGMASPEQESARDGDNRSLSLSGVYEHDEEGCCMKIIWGNGCAILMLRTRRGKSLEMDEDGTSMLHGHNSVYQSAEITCLETSDGDMAAILEITIIHIWDVVGCVSQICWDRGVTIMMESAEHDKSGCTAR